MKSIHFSTKSAFTIVELLVVIVVIGILTSVSVVAYSGIQTRAYTAVIKSDLSNFSKTVGLYRAFNGNELPRAHPSGSGSGYSIQSVLADLQSVGDVKFTPLDAYDSMTIQEKRGLMMTYGDASRGVDYFCLAVKPRGGAPVYYSTESGIFEPTMSGTAQNGYDFINNCTTNDFPVAYRTYGPFSISDYS